MSYSMIKITVATRAAARDIARALVDARLAASVNLIPEIASVYRWDGAVREATETLLLAKTRTALVGQVSDFVKARHSYRCPCILAVPIGGGNPDYLDWIARETAAG